MEPSVPNRRGGAVADIGNHDGPWSEAEHLALVTSALADGSGCIELVDGALLVGPGVGAARVEVAEQARAAIAGALPDGLRVAVRAALRLRPGCVLLPDLVVTRAPDGPDGAPEVLAAADALMVVEVVGRAHGAPYRLFKPQLYARSRIPYSVLVDHDAPFGAADMLLNGRYHEYARSADAAVLVVEEPFRLRIPLIASTTAAS